MLLIGLVVVLYVSLDLLFHPINGLVYVGLIVPVYALYMLLRVVFTGSASQTDVTTTCIVIAISFLYFIPSNPLSAWGIGFIGIIISSLVVACGAVIRFIPNIHNEMAPPEAVRSQRAKTKSSKSRNNKMISLYILVAATVQYILIYYLGSINFIGSFNSFFFESNLWGFVFIPVSLYIGVIFSRYKGVLSWIEGHRLVTTVIVGLVVQVLSSLVLITSTFQFT